MKKCFLLLFVLCAYVVTGAVLPAWADRAPVPVEEINPGYVFVGPVGDGGWTFTLDVGRRAVDAAFPGMRSAYVESVPAGPESVAVMERLIRQHGSRLIIAGSFGYMDFVQEVAQRHPNVVFMHISGFRRAHNVGTLFGRMYQPRFLSGIVAGSLSESGNIGYVAAHPIPEVIRMINAFTLGARKVNPDATVNVVWLHSWHNPGMEREATQALIEEGVDMMAMHADTGAVAQASEEAGVFVIGYNNDMSRFAPTMHLTAPIWNWERLFAPVVQQIADGTWESEAVWLGMDEKAVALAPFGPAVPEEVRNMVLAEKERVIAREQLIFTGPIRDQTGTVRVPEGVTMTDDEIWSMNWFVEGVIGEIP